MDLVADLHIHSHFSRATSKRLDLEHLTRWAQLKGVHIVGTGDIAHPGWLAEMREKLEPAEEGLFRLKDGVAAAVQQTVPGACQGMVRFMLAGEISNIYKKHDKVRKIHNVVFAPNLDAVAQIQAELEKIGNIRSDGRPILGLDSRDLLEIVLEVDARCHLIPAHIWTPWFSLLGSKSGFDSVAECFDDLTPHIFALETGLSSDPPMNWRVSALDGYTLVSNSDAHSPSKLAREATLFDSELSYDALFQALHSGNPATFKGTIEFFPQEGKYHYDGHRKCNVCWHPQTTRAQDGLCPECGKPVTVGVMHRVETLADRPESERPAHTHPFHSLIPLPELLSEIHHVGAKTKTVRTEHMRLLGRLGPELAILRQIPLAEIEAVGGFQLAEGIGRMRRGEVVAEPGYDGEYGVIKVFDEVVGQVSSLQMGLFGEAGASETSEQDGHEFQPAQQPEPVPRPGHDKDAGAPEQEVQPAAFAGKTEPEKADGQRSLTNAASHPALAQWLEQLNDEQRAAVLCTDVPLVIVAGPGTGKTRTLTVRIAYLIQEQQVPPESILAITFTNKAAAEMAERLIGLVGAPVVDRIAIQTFHAFGAGLLREQAARLGLDPNFAICNEEERSLLLKQACPALSQRAITDTLNYISAAKNRLLGPDAPDLADAVGARGEVGAELAARYAAYETALRASHALDFDDLIRQTVYLLESCPDLLQALHERLGWISVDEYQDVNFAQYRLLRLLTAGGANLCVIGDPDQAIYGFRGADRRYFLSFAEDYPGARTLHLSRNYRSTQLILDAATQVIDRNPDREAIRIWSDFAERVKVDVYRAPTDRAEAEYVVHQIEQMVGGTSYFSLDSGRVDDDTAAVERTFADFAVLYRLGAQSRLLVEAFDRSGIPYQTVGQTPFFARKPVREILAHLWLLHTPASRLHLEILLAGGSGRPPSAVVAPILQSMRTGLSLAEALGQRAYAGELDAGSRQRLVALAGFYSEFSEEKRHPVAALVERAHRLLAEQDRPLPDVDLERLLQRAQAFGTRLRAFLEATALQGEADVYDPRADRVALMTLHAAKGLEFPVVFIVGCEDGLLPYRPQRKAADVKANAEKDIEEERRLFYVGMTRAQRKLIFTHARSRFLFGQRQGNPSSPFLDDIERALTEVQEARRRAGQPPRPEDVQLRLF